MIAVIADDFSGAAEIAGIGLRYGLNIQLTMSLQSWNGADLLIVCTDSRSMKEKEAIQITTQVTRQLLAYQPEFIYKKIDSVLRGHVFAELKVQAAISGNSNVFILPANPGLGRIIRSGKYYINNVEIHHTGFSLDPEFPVRDSSVIAMLGSHEELKLAAKNDPMDRPGYYIAEAQTSRDLEEWAQKVDKNWMLTGAGDFFTALMEKQFEPVATAKPSMEAPFLFVSGTTYDESRRQIQIIQEKHACIVYFNGENETECLNEAGRILKGQGACILAFGNLVKEISAEQLRTKMAVLTDRVVQENRIAELLIEGGSTAAAILKQMNILDMQPVHEWSRGVVRMKGADLFITVKPGSYPLPGLILEIFS